MNYDDSNFFNRSIHDAVKHGGDHWRIYQQIHTHERTSNDMTFDAHEFYRTYCEITVKRDFTVASRYANWG